jgi:hypothetical protein
LQTGAGGPKIRPLFDELIAMGHKTEAIGWPVHSDYF